MHSKYVFSTREFEKISSKSFDTRYLSRVKRSYEIHDLKNSTTCRILESFPFKREHRILDARKKRKKNISFRRSFQLLGFAANLFSIPVFSVESFAKSYGSSKLIIDRFSFGDRPTSLISNPHGLSQNPSTIPNRLKHSSNAFPSVRFIFQYVYFSETKTSAEARDASSLLHDGMEWKGSPPVFLPCGGVPPVLSSSSFPSRSKCIRGNFTNASSEHFHFRGRRRRHGVSAGVCNRFVGCARRKSRVYPTFTHPCTFARTRLYIRDTRLLVPRFHPGGRKIHLSSNGEYETRITFLALIKRNGTKRDINCLENGGWISWYSSGERGDKSGRRKGERKGRKRFEKMVVVRGWKKKKGRSSEAFLRAYIRIFDIDAGSSFSFRSVDLSLIIHVTRTPDTRKRSWGICFRCMAACRYILFTVYSPLPSVPPHRLIYGFPSRYSSPSCSSRALRLFLRVYPDLARASFTLFRPRREKLRPR